MEDVPSVGKIYYGTQPYKLTAQSACGKPSSGQTRRFTKLIHRPTGKALLRPRERVLRFRDGPGAASLRRAYFWRLLKEKTAAKRDQFDGECGGGRRPMGRRRQGQDRRLAVVRGRHRGALPGRPQCRAYARHRQQCL